MKDKIKRIVTDIAGYSLLILAVLTGWLPGPGGIPLALAGLGLLSIHNEWAMHLRDYLLDHGGKVIQFFFPPIKWIQWGYDIIVVLLLIGVYFLAEEHRAIWQIGLAVVIFFVALAIAGLNRERFARLRSKTNSSD